MSTGSEMVSEAVARLRQERDEALAESHEQARLLGIGSEREARLIAERDEYRAQVEREVAARAGLEHEIAKLANWQLSVAEGLGYCNRAEGQSGYEVAEPSIIVAEFKRLECALEEAEDQAQRTHNEVRRDYDKTVADCWRAEVAKKDARISALESGLREALLLLETYPTNDFRLKWLDETRALLRDEPKTAPKHGFKAKCQSCADTGSVAVCDDPYATQSCPDCCAGMEKPSPESSHD